MPQYNANLFFLEKTPECVLTLSKVRSEYQEKERRKEKQFHIQFQKLLTIFLWLMLKVRKVVFGPCLDHLFEDLKLFTKYKKHLISYVRFQRFLSRAVRTENFCNFGKVF